MTGVAALLKAANPGWDWRAIKNLILAGGDNVASMANTITQKRLNAFGALTCTNSPVFSRLRPIGDTISGAVGRAVILSVLNINCADPNGDVDVTVNPGSEIVTLRDDGLGSDQAAGDGVYSGLWNPPASGNFALTFPDGSVLTVTVSTPTIGVTPAALDFGGVNVGTSVDKTFSVQNVGSGTLTGSATANIPYAIVSGGSYSLTARQSQTVTVRFSPTTTGTFSGNVTFTGGGGASRPITGVSVPAATLTATPDSLLPGETLTAAWSGIAAPTATDWIGLYKPGAANSPSITWRYTTGAASGSVPLVLPSTVIPDTYELRLFANNGYTRLATSTTFVVTLP